MFPRSVHHFLASAVEKTLKTRDRNIDWYKHFSFYQNSSFLCQDWKKDQSIVSTFNLILTLLPSLKIQDLLNV